jgi:hypothetical protein
MNWTDIRNVNNNTPIYNVAWLDGERISYDLLFSEAPGVSRDSIDWTDKNPELGNTYRHRYASEYYTWTNSSNYDGNDGYVGREGYGIAVRDEVRYNLSAITISGSTYRDLGLKNWQDWKPVYNPYTNISTYLNPGDVMVDTDSGEPEPTSGSGFTTKDIAAAYMGTDSVAKIYLGSEVVWAASQPEPVYSAMPLTFEILSAGTIYLRQRENANQATCEYKIYNSESDYLNNAFADAELAYGGTGWTGMISSTGDSQAISVQPGQYVAVRANKGTTPWARQSGSAYSNMFSGTALYNLMGNIMSLNYPTPTDYIPWATNSSFSGDSYAYSFANIFFGANVVSARDLRLPDYVPDHGFSQLFHSNQYLVETPQLTQAALNIYCYFGMFGNCTSLTTAPELTATTLAANCYQNMFSACTSLTTAPVLPATSLTTGCYVYMFQGCTGLTQAPELPATILADSCYYSMFKGCSSLTTAPVLPATSLTISCYAFMFQNCTSLTTAPVLPATSLMRQCYTSMFAGCTSLTQAPELPATTLANNCYSGMFNGCSSLTTAPVLPATSLVSSCYATMFNNCSSLNYVKCLATSGFGQPTSSWLYGVSASGTFVKHPNATTWPGGISGIPNSWTVQNADI